MAALASEGLRIRRAEPSDYAGFARTMATPRVVAGALQSPMPSLDTWRERMDASHAEAFPTVAKAPQASGCVEAQDPVGHLGLMPTGSTSPRRRHAMSLGTRVRDDWRGRAIDSALLEAGLECADCRMQGLRLELTAFVDNEAAVALYRRHGFAIEGRHRAHASRGGEHVDAYAMARLHPRPPLLPSADDAEVAA